MTEIPRRNGTVALGIWGQIVKEPDIDHSNGEKFLRPIKNGLE